MASNLFSDPKNSNQIAPDIDAASEMNSQVQLLPDISKRSTA